jgi:hypothetical protein
MGVTENELYAVDDEVQNPLSRLTRSRMNDYFFLMR